MTIMAGAARSRACGDGFAGVWFSDGPRNDAQPRGDAMESSEKGAGSGEPESRKPLPGVHRDQEQFWREVLALADDVERALKTAVEALCEARPDLIAGVKAEEAAIDRWEVRIERECLRLLALYGLVASDLRKVVAALRVNRDLEGLADLAENIAKRAKKLSQDPVARPYLARLRSLADLALPLVHDGLESLRTLDPDLARRVIEADIDVDRHRLAIVAELKQALRGQPDRVNTWLRLINSARNLERAADHATNIAEAVVTMKEGRVFRRGESEPTTD
jgi:phosphate transport system protein